MPCIGPLKCVLPYCARFWWRYHRRGRIADDTNQEPVMSKGMDRKKEDKKKPAKTIMEKRAAKQAKRQEKSFKAG